MKKPISISLILAGSMLLSSHASADSHKTPAPMPAEMQQMAKNYTPEMRQNCLTG